MKLHILKLFISNTFMTLGHLGHVYSRIISDGIGHTTNHQTSIHGQIVKSLFWSNSKCLWKLLWEVYCVYICRSGSQKILGGCKVGIWIGGKLVFEEISFHLMGETDGQTDRQTDRQTQRQRENSSVIGMRKQQTLTFEANPVQILGSRIPDGICRRPRTCRAPVLDFGHLRIVYVAR